MKESDGNPEIQPAPIIEKLHEGRSLLNRSRRKSVVFWLLLVIIVAIGCLLLGHYVLPSTQPAGCPEATTECRAPAGLRDATAREPTKNPVLSANSSVSVKDEKCGCNSSAPTIDLEHVHRYVDVGPLLDAIDDDSVEEHIQFLAAAPHVAGSAWEEQTLAHYVADRFTEYGFDDVRLVPYHVLLSYPNASEPNSVQLVNSTTGDVTFEASTREEPVDGFNTDIGSAFLAFSPPGDVLGCLVYVNRATHQDLDQVEALNVTISGCVCLAREGGSTLASKAFSCARRGAVGLVVFPDHYSDEEDGTSSSTKAFPFGPRMPDTLLRRDTMMHVGDPLTPGVPAIVSAERMDPAFAGLPPIPSQPISFRDATMLLRTLKGPEAPRHFQPNKNETFRLGDGSLETLLRLRVNNVFNLALVNNVIATMRGSVEPDRYVVVGAQRDSFGHGALRPAPSTASLLALGQALGKLKELGSRSRRSILLCSWAAGEYGQVGSTEWVEEHLFELQSRATVYLDISECCSGDFLVPKTWPTLETLAVDAASRVPDSRQPNMTLYEVWQQQHEEQHIWNISVVRPETMDAMSDNVPFSHYAGVPSMSFRFLPHEGDGSGSSESDPTYPAYHTAYDTLLLYNNWTNHHLTPLCARLHGAALWLASESPLLPVNFSALANCLEDSLEELRSGPTALELELNGVSLNPLRLAIERFRKAADNWTLYLETLNHSRPELLRELNDRAMLAEQALLKTTGLPGRPLTRHLLWSPSEFDRRKVTGFPVLADLLFYISQLPPDTRDQGWKNVRFYLADVLVALRSAAAALLVPAS